jgi:hypothetical protein
MILTNGSIWPVYCFSLSGYLTLESTVKNSLAVSAASFAAILLSAATASAVPIGSTTFSPASNNPAYTFSSTPGSLQTLTSFSFKGANLATNSTSTTNGNGSSNVLYTPAGDIFISGGSNSVTISPATVGLTLSDLASDGVIGVFTQTTPATVLSNVSSGQFASETIDIEGTLSGGTAEGGQTLGASLTFSLTQTGGAGSSISISGTLATPSSFVPEPASLAILGAGLLGIGFIRHRRNLG